MAVIACHDKLTGERGEEEREGEGEGRGRRQRNQMLLRTQEASRSVHYGNQGGHYPHVLLRPFLVFLIAP